MPGRIGAEFPLEDLKKYINARRKIGSDFLPFT